MVNAGITLGRHFQGIGNGMLNSKLLIKMEHTEVKGNKNIFCGPFSSVFLELRLDFKFTKSNPDSL